MIDRLRWLHLSDFHFTSAGDPFSQNVAARALLEDLKAHLAEGPPPMFILVTGDLAYSGKADEYDVAEEFLRRLVDQLGLSLGDLYLVPGNHDVDRTRQSYALSGVRQALVSQSAVDKFLGNLEDCAQLLERQSAFWALEERLRGSDRTFLDNKLGYAAVVQLEDFRIGILGLNTAWLCAGEDDNGRLVMGERQILEMLGLAEPLDAQLLIAAAHHPIEWLTEWDAATCHTRLLPAVDLFHRGHLHASQVAYASVPELPCLMVAAGSSHATRHYMNSYNVIDLDLANARCRIQPYIFLPQRGGFVPDQPHEAPFQFKSELPGTLQDLADAVQGAVPMPTDGAAYVAALLSARMGDLPARVGGTVGLLRPETAMELGDEEDRAQVAMVLRARNLLRLFPRTYVVADRVATMTNEIAAVADWLEGLAKADAAFGHQLEQQKRSALALCGQSESAPRQRTMDFLAELHASGDSELLEPQARRHVNSDDASLSRFATEALADVLMRSDEASKVREAHELARHLCERDDARASDYLRASASAEAASDDVVAVTFATRGLQLFADDQELVTYARGLALRAGSPELRDIVESL